MHSSFVNTIDSESKAKCREKIVSYSTVQALSCATKRSSYSADMKKDLIVETTEDTNRKEERKE